MIEVVRSMSQFKWKSITYLSISLVSTYVETHLSRPLYMCSSISYHCHDTHVINKWFKFPCKIIKWLCVRIWREKWKLLNAKHSHSTDQGKWRLPLLRWFEWKQNDKMALTTTEKGFFQVENSHRRRETRVTSNLY